MVGQLLSIGLVFTIILEIIIEGVIKKSTPYVLEPYLRLVKESLYLYKITKKTRFSNWDESNRKYVDRNAAQIQIGAEKLPQSMSHIFSIFLSLGNSQPIVLTGEPGSGKTTTLEAFTYQAARSVLQRNKIFLEILLIALLIGMITIRDYFLAFFIFLIAFSFCLRLVIPTIIFLRAMKQVIQKAITKFLVLPQSPTAFLIPILIDARSDYGGGDIKEWCAKISSEKLGARRLHFNQNDGITWIIDGINEISANLYPIFVEGWRAILQDSPSIPVVFSSRSDQNPFQRLGLEYSYKLLPLDNNGVKEFLWATHKSKAVDEGLSLIPEQINIDFQNLMNKGLLTENGIARNPYWLKLLLISGQYTPNIGRLFHKSVVELLNREIEEKPEERKRKTTWKNIVPINVELSILIDLAYAMHKEKKIGYNSEEGWVKARQIIQDKIGDLPYTIDDVLDEAEAATLLVAQTKERVEFVHQLVQEFFVAMYLNNIILKSTAEDNSLYLTSILGETLFQSGSYEIISMLVGVSDRQLDIVNWLASQIVEKRHPQFIPLLRRSVEIINEAKSADTTDIVVNLLLSCLPDPDIHVRWNTVVMLGEVKNPNTLEPLIIDLLEPESFHHHGIDKYLKNIEASSKNSPSSPLRDTDSFIQRHAIRKLLNQDDEQVIESLILALKDDDPNIRWQAVYTLGRIGNDRALSELEKFVEDDQGIAQSKFRINYTAQEAIKNIRDRIASAKSIE